MPIDPRIALQARPATFDIGEAIQLREMADRRRMQERIAADQLSMQAERLDMDRSRFRSDIEAKALDKAWTAKAAEALVLSGGNYKKAYELLAPENPGLAARYLEEAAKRQDAIGGYNSNMLKRGEEAAGIIGNQLDSWEKSYGGGGAAPAPAPAPSPAEPSPQSQPSISPASGAVSLRTMTQHGGSSGPGGGFSIPKDQSQEDWEKTDEYKRAKERYDYLHRDKPRGIRLAVDIPGLGAPGGSPVENLPFRQDPDAPKPDPKEQIQLLSNDQVIESRQKVDRAIQVGQAFSDDVQAFKGTSWNDPQAVAAWQQMRQRWIDSGMVNPKDVPERPDPRYIAFQRNRALGIMGRLEYAGKQLDLEAKRRQLEYDANKERRAQQEFDATLPGKKADSEKKGVDAKIAGMQAEFMENDPGKLKPNERATADAAAARIREGIEARKQRAADAAAGRAVTMRGQNMADARARDKAEKAKDEKPPTSAERRAAGYLIRAQGAAEAIKDMEDDMAKKGLFSQAWYSYAPNFVQSDLNQAYRDAQREFTEARLRKDSGAAIPPAEFENDAKTYFPQPGDSANTLRVKAEARNRLIRALRLESGRAAAEADAAAGAGIEESGPKVGTVEDGYRFKGGDPSKPENWEKVR